MHFFCVGGGSVFLKSNKKKGEEKKQEQLSYSDEIDRVDYEQLKETNALESSLRYRVQ